MAMISERWTRVRTLGRGASGAEVFLAADDMSGQLFAVKSACASGAAALRREQGIMSVLQSPRVVSCVGGSAGRDGSYQLFLEFAPGGSLADEIAKDGGLEERAVRAYAADVAEGLVYLHGAGMVHGDVKARNVVIGADGRAKLADFGCARKADGGPIIGGTPAFMAPEVARGEEQGSAADVWALGCTVVEMATGRAPWNGAHGDALAAMHRIGYTDTVPDVPQWLSTEAKDFLAGCLARKASDRCTVAQLLEHPFLASAAVPWSGAHGDALAALHRIGYTDAVPEVPQWLSAEAKDFLAGCLSRNASDRCTAAQLLEHPFLASAVLDTKLEDVKSKWVSPKSTLDAALWESESDNDEADDELSSHSAAERIKALSCPASAVPDWDSDEGWIDVLSAPTEASDMVAVPAEETTHLDDAISSEEQPADCGLLHVTMDSSVLNVVVEANYDSELHSRHQSFGVSVCYETVPPCKLSCNNRSMNAIDFVPAQNTLFFLFANFSAPTWQFLCRPGRDTFS